MINIFARVVVGEELGANYLTQSLSASRRWRRGCLGSCAGSLESGLAASGVLALPWGLGRGAKWQCSWKQLGRSPAPQLGPPSAHARLRVVVHASYVSGRGDASLA